MSVHITSQVWTESQATGPALLVLLSLADQANDQGVCWPSIPSIANRCRMSERSVHRHLAALVESGDISKQERVGQSSVYHVHPCQSVTPANLSPLTAVSPPPLPPVSPTPATVGRQNRQEPSVEPSVKDSPSSDDDDARFAEFWESYPRKVGKGQARAAYSRARRKATPDLILSSLRVLVRAYQGQPVNFIPHPATWLNGERWTDDPQAVARSTINRRQSETDDQFARMLARAAERDAQQKAISQ